KAAHAGEFVARLDVGRDARRLQGQEGVDIGREIFKRARRVEKLVEGDRGAELRQGVDVRELVTEPCLEVGKLLRRQTGERGRLQPASVQGGFDLFSGQEGVEDLQHALAEPGNADDLAYDERVGIGDLGVGIQEDRKSTRLNSSHVKI